MGIEPDTDRIRQDDEPATDPAGIPVEAFGRAPEDRPLDHQPEPDAGDSGMSPALVSFEAFSGGPSEDFYVGLDGPSAAGPESLSLPGLGQDRLDPERQSSPDTLHPGIEGVMGDPAPVSGAAADDTDAISGMMTPDTYAPSTPTFGGPAAGGRPFDAAPPRLQANPPVTPPPQSGPYEPPALSGMTPAASMAARRPTMGNPLDSFGLFLDFQPREKAMLAQYLAPISAVAGQGLLAGDEDRDGLVLLVNGRVQVTQGRGASRTMNGPTFLAAEMLLSGDLPPIQATAESDVEAFILSREAARNLAEVDRPLAVKLAKTLRSVTAIG
jgi:hypothetical protein